MSQAPPYTGSFNSDNLDSSYRCLADFSRMITIAISDNIFPDLKYENTFFSVFIIIIIILHVCVHIKTYRVVGLALRPGGQTG